MLPACKATLAALRLDYLDLYLMHWPIALAPHVGLGFPDTANPNDYLTLTDVPLLETWQTMEELVKLGLVRYLGVSNFSQSKLEGLLAKATIYPAVNQIESHPYLAQSNLINYCRQNKISVTAFAPLGSPSLVTQDTTSTKPILLQDPAIAAIATVHNATTAQVVLAWQLQRGVSVIPKSTNEARLVEKFAAQDLHLTDEEIKRIDNLDMNFRYYDLAFWEGEGSPYTATNILE